MKQILISTYNKKLYDDYANQLITSYYQTQQELELHIFVEDDINLYPKGSNLHYHNLFEEEPESLKFRDRNKNRVVGDFFQDAVRFSYKVFAQSAARKYADKVFYVDSDSVFVKTIPMEWYDQCLPENVFISFYDRPKQYTETGFVAFNNTKKCTDKFFKQYKEWYIHDTVYDIKIKGKKFFTDCHTLDLSRKMLANEDEYIEHKLGDSGMGHIMARDKFINQYLDHRKGPRKYKPHSPEWSRNQ